MDPTLSTTKDAGNVYIECECSGVKVILRSIRREDLKEVHRIMPWGTTWEDVEDAFTNQPGALYGAFLADKPNQLISHIMATIWEKKYCYICWYVTDHAYRSLGVGTHLCDIVKHRLFSVLHGECPVLLEAFPEMVQVYASLGYIPIRKEHGISGKPKIPEDVPALPGNVAIRNLTDDNFSYLEEYDKQFHEVDRTALLKRSLIRPPVRYTKIALSDTKCVGYGCVRKTDEGHFLICPLVADDSAIAEHLLRELIVEHNLQEERVLLYLPEENLEQSMTMIGKYGLDQLEDGMTMMCFRTKLGIEMCGKIPWNKMYAIMFNNLTLL